jgi:hypothetical protein
MLRFWNLFSWKQANLKIYVTVSIPRSRWSLFGTYDDMLAIHISTFFWWSWITSILESLAQPQSWIPQRHTGRITFLYNMSLLWTDSSELLPSNHYRFLNLMVSISYSFFNMPFPPQLGNKSYTMIFCCIGIWNLCTIEEDWLLSNLLAWEVSIYRFGFVEFWRMVSSGMLRLVVHVRTDVSEELSTSFIRVTRIGELGKR